MQNAVPEPASHGMDWVIAVLPSMFVDTTFRKKDCTDAIRVIQGAR